MATEIEFNADGTYNVIYNDEDYILTTVTSSGYKVESWLNEIQWIHRRRLNRLIVGLDVEWHPNFIRGRGQNPVALLQLCVGRRCLLFQILHADYIPGELDAFLSDHRFTFVGVGIYDDAQRLWDDYELDVVRREDLRGLAAERMGRPDLKRAGLQNIVRAVTGVHVDKPRAVRMSAWDARALSYEQIMYACADAFISFEAGRRLFAGDF